MMYVKTHLLTQAKQSLALFNFFFSKTPSDNFGWFIFQIWKWVSAKVCVILNSLFCTLKKYKSVKAVK